VWRAREDVPPSLTSCCSCSTQLASSGSVASSPGRSTLDTPPLLPLLLPLLLPPARLSASASPVPAPAVAVDAPGGGSAPAGSVVGSCLGPLGGSGAGWSSAAMMAMRFCSFCV